MVKIEDKIIEDISAYIDDYISKTNFVCKNEDCDSMYDFFNNAIQIAQEDIGNGDCGQIESTTIYQDFEQSLDLYIGIYARGEKYSPESLRFNFVLADEGEGYYNYLYDASIKADELSLSKVADFFSQMEKTLLSYDRLPKGLALYLLGNTQEEQSAEEIIDKDFIYKIDDSNKFTVELDYDNVDEFITEEPTGDTRQDTIKICAIDTKIPIIQIQKTAKKDEMIFLVDLFTEDRREFKTKAYMKTKEDFNKLISETVDMLNSSSEFCKYASDLEDFIK